MRKNLSPGAYPVNVVGRCEYEAHDQPEQAERMRALLRGFAARAADGSLGVKQPDKQADEVERGDGHFHLAPELFLQATGWTRFRFPHAELRLDAGEALLLPPKLLHAERVGAGADGAAFCNLVIYAEDSALSCHIAHEAEPGRPGIVHLEASRHPQAARVQEWLADAARFGPGSDTDAPPWATAQLRALVAATTAGVLRVLDDPDPAERPEPSLIARVRVLIQNQLGDQALSVRRLAEQSGCTPDYLSHVFSRTTGEHLAGFIVRQRLERAARLLADTAMAGKEVAWACGFATPSYFIRSFRAQFGVTPRAWRSGASVAG